MKNSSLDTEPPSKLAREEEVSKRNINLNQLILSTKSNRNKNASVRTEKNTEKQIKLNFQNYIFDEDYKKSSSLEEISITAKALSFTNNLNSNLNTPFSGFEDIQKRSTSEIMNKKLPRFYDINSTYSFIPNAKQEEKKEDISYQLKEQQTKETTYALHNLDEEPEKEY